MLTAFKVTLFILFPLTALMGIKVYGRGEFSEDVFPKQASLYWRGIAALMVLLGHLTTFLESKGISVGIAYLFDWAGGIGVLIFFFLSGYGTGISLKGKTVDIRWLICHILWLWIPAMIVRTILGIPYINMPREYFLFVVGVRMQDWFIAALIYIYITVYISRRYYPKNHIVALFVLNVISGIIFYVLNFGPGWYNAPLCYTFGVWMAEKGFRRIYNYARKHWIICVVVVCTVFLINSICFTYYKGSAVSIFLKLTSGVCISTLIMVISMKIKKYGAIMQKIGEASLYLYIIHMHLYERLGEAFPNNVFIGVFLTIIISLPMALFCSHVENKARAYTRRLS